MSDETTPNAESDELYYLQSYAGVVGNAMLWWAKDGYGYTCNLDKAHVFTFDEVMSVVRGSYEKSWRIWPKSHIDKVASRSVDIQHVDSSLEHKDEQVEKRRKAWLEERHKAEACIDSDDEY